MTAADDPNRAVFDSAATVADYEATTELTPVEAALFAQHVPANSDVLDLGVGTGRTTPALAQRARTYIGIDYAPHMIDVARSNHPDADLRVGDAADLSGFADASFDAVVFSYNGLDYLHPDSVRRRCLAEVRRVLRPGAVFVLSVHNPRALVRPARPDTAAGRGRAKSVAITAIASARAALRLLPSRAFWAGDGYVVDSARPLLTHMATRRRVNAEMGRCGFAPVTVAGNHTPDRTVSLWTPWYYYVFRRAEP